MTGSAQTETGNLQTQILMGDAARARLKFPRVSAKEADIC